MKVLLGYDGSNTAKAAVQLAIHYGKGMGAEIDVITSRVRGDVSDAPDIDRDEIELSAIEEKIKAAGITCRTHLLIRGFTVGEDLVRFAEENDCDLIIIGVRRRSRVGKILMGSSAQYVILKAPCPVLTVK